MHTMELTHMMIMSTPLLLLLLIISLFSLLVLFISRSKKKKQLLLLPPGPRQLPIIGSLHHLFGSLPHKALHDLSRKHGPIMHLKLGETSAIVVSSPEAAREVLKNQDVSFASRAEFVRNMYMSYGGQDVAFAPYGDYWRQIKKLCVVELLNAKRVQSFRHIREEEVSNLVRLVYNDTVELKQPANLTKMINASMNNVAMRSSIGSNYNKEQAAEFQSRVLESMKIAAGFDIADYFPSLSLVAHLAPTRRNARAIQRRLDDVLDGLIIAREKNTDDAAGSASEEECENNNFLDVLLKLQASGELGFQLTNDNLKAILLDMFSGGGETSTNVVVWAMSELMSNPAAMEKAVSEVREAFRGRSAVSEVGVVEEGRLPYLKLVIKETMRLHAPLPLLLPRKCNKKGCEIDGYAIPEGSRIFVNVWAIGRDPGSWEAPEEFRPERFEKTSPEASVDFRGNNFELLPFGAGRRMCPGITFGLGNVDLFLAHLLYYFDWKLPVDCSSCVAPDGSLDMTESFELTIRRKNDLRLLAVPASCVPTWNDLHLR